MIDDREQDPSIDDPVQDLQLDEAKDKIVSNEDVTQTRVAITDYDTKASRPQMIWVFEGKDNYFEANSGCIIYVLF